VLLDVWDPAKAADLIRAERATFIAFVARRFLQSVRRNSYAAHRESVGSLVAYGQVSQKPFRWVESV